MSESSPPSLPLSVTVGFLAVVTDGGGVLGGYLVTNAWGRPLEFRLTTAVQPSRVQHILYGPTMTEYLHADLIGKTLVEKTGTQPSLIVTDSASALTLRSRVDVPVVAIGGAGEEETVTLTHPRASLPLLLAAKFEQDTPTIVGLLDRLDPAIDLTEPFARIREAVAEARKMGVTGRAA